MEPKKRTKTTQEEGNFKPSITASNKSNSDFLGFDLR